MVAATKQTIPPVTKTVVKPVHSESLARPFNRRYDIVSKTEWSEFWISYIKNFLDGHPAFNPNLAKTNDSPQTIAHLQIENEKQKQKLLSLQEELRKTKKLLQMSKQSYTELNREYKKLLGRYQTDVGKKIIHF